MNQVKLAFRVILTHFGGKRSEKLRMGEIGCSKSFWATSVGKIGKVANQVKLAVPSHSEPLRWEKIRKVANQAKLAVLSHSEPLRWKKNGKVPNQVKFGVPSHSEPLRWKRLEKFQIGQNWLFKVILSHFSGNRSEKL